MVDYKKPQPSHYWDKVENRQTKYQKPTQTHYWDDYRNQLYNSGGEGGPLPESRTTLASLQLIEWARSYARDVSFEPPLPEPFTTVSPAVDIEETIITPETFSTPAGMSTIVVPQNIGERAITVTFYDDIGSTVENWLHDWYNEIYNTDNQYITTLEEATRIITIKRRDLQKNTIKFNSYLVFPRSPLQFIGSSDSAVRQHSQEFVIAGTTS